MTREVIKADLEKLKEIVEYGKSKDHNHAILKGEVVDFEPGRSGALNVVEGEEFDE